LKTKNSSGEASRRRIVNGDSSSDSLSPSPCWRIYTGDKLQAGVFYPHSFKYLLVGTDPSERLFCQELQLAPFSLRSATLIAFRSGFSTEAAQEIDDEADQENQAKASSSDCGATEVKAATAKQKKKNKN